MSEQSHVEAERRFKELAALQRDKPERAMLKAQMMLSKTEHPSANALGWIMEHIGDLTHRMTEYGAAKDQVKYAKEFVAPKVDRGLMVINNSVDRERMSRIPNYPELEAYSSEHAKLPVYNNAQRAARNAAVHLGKKDFDRVEENLQYLRNLLNDGTAFEDEASRYDPELEKLK